MMMTNDIYFKKQYLGSVPNQILVDEIKDGLKRLRTVIPRRQGFELGFIALVFDSMAKNNEISEGERRAACHILDRAYQILNSQA